MKDWFLIPMMAVLFVFGCFVMKKLDRALEDNRKRIGEEAENSCIRIGVESDGIMEQVEGMLGYCTSVMPEEVFLLDTSSPKNLMYKLEDDRIDLLFLRESEINTEDDRFRYTPAVRKVRFKNLPDDAGNIVLVWNRKTISADRDRVIAALSTTV